MSYYKVHDRRMEQFLFFHDIFFTNSYRLEDGSVVWEYEDTDRFREILREWQEILRRRAERKRHGCFQRPLPRGL